MDPDLSAKLDEYLRNEPARNAEHEAFMAEANSLISRIESDIAIHRASTEQTRRSRLELERRIEEFRRGNARE
ncbi:MAG TPA: hypothetical protein VG345_01785 [Bryobacteraceae bacterium]|jgi:hypothetical protein|nr:hypothetical protein [Bryobacteraceae bacterium]